MSTKSSTTEKELMPGMAAAQAFWQSALGQSGEWMQGQPQGFAFVQGAAERWMRHRSEDFQKGMAAATQMASCRDISQAAAIQQKWLAECTQSLMADWMALISPATEVMRRQGSAVKESSFAVEKKATEPA